MSSVSILNDNSDFRFRGLKSLSTLRFRFPRPPRHHDLSRSPSRSSKSHGCPWTRPETPVPLGSYASPPLPQVSEYSSPLPEPVPVGGPEVHSSVSCDVPLSESVPKGPCRKTSSSVRSKHDFLVFYLLCLRPRLPFTTLRGCGPPPRERRVQ